ncbi:MAG: gliding motility protein GldN [Rhizobacter sp.]|nr:gliding motility protein GldN [Ferruginibacter sp.]
MKNQIWKYLLLVIFLGAFADDAMAQKKKKATTRKSTKRTTSTRTKTKIKPTVATADTIAAVAAVAAPAVEDTLPIKKVLISLRPDEAVETTVLRDRTPLPYEHLRADDAVYRHKIWREIDVREKINLPFRYSADESNGNQRFISILLRAIQDSAVTVFDASIDDRFTTPMTISQVAGKVAGDVVQVPIYDSLGNLTGTKEMRNEVNLDSIVKFHIKEEVIFDKESSRLFWRILGIAPVKKVVTSMGVDMGDMELFWVYYPDMRATFAKYEVYNGKNFGARMSWEELFESRMFYGRIIKSTIDNPYDKFIKFTPGLTENPILQLLEGENIKEKIFNYEQDLWSY